MEYISEMLSSRCIFITLYSYSWSDILRTGDMYSWLRLTITDTYVEHKY